MNQPIGVIDSGVGGLTVAQEILRQLPNENICYLGDTLRCPYGPRDTEQVKEFTMDMTNYLLEHDIKLLVIACNTATAAALQYIREHVAIPVVGVIQPGARAALKATKNNQIGVIGTEGTIKSQAYNSALDLLDHTIKVQTLACPKFAPVVESSEYKGSVAKKIVAQTLRPFKNSGVDTFVLGCTHYPLLQPIIENVLGSSVKVINPGLETASEVSMLLDYFSLRNVSGEKNQHRFFTTGSTKIFWGIARDWLDVPNLEVEYVKIGQGRF
ncbi:glutamate racemase [Brochothrix thermosphacta]|uniref:glutamate racemase n=1 Tax=Brochothrix thermosphacta TaxID=2756 RepID=UPI0039B0A34A